MFKKVCFVSVSGGKDSTLTLALALEKYGNTDVPVIALFCDTGWEHPLTYEYLDELEEFFGIRIHRLKGVEGGLPELIKKKKPVSWVPSQILHRRIKAKATVPIHKRMVSKTTFQVCRILDRNQKR